MKAFEVIEVEGVKDMFIVRFNFLNETECNRLIKLLSGEKEFLSVQPDHEKGYYSALRIRMDRKSDKCSADYVKATIECYLSDPKMMEYIETGKAGGVDIPDEAPAMVSRRDHELYEAVIEKATEFYERDEENRAVFLLMMDKETEHINGCILGERNNIMSGIAHSLSKDEHLLMDVTHVTQQLLLEGAIDALKEIKDKTKK